MKTHNFLIYLDFKKILFTNKRFQLESLKRSRQSNQTDQFVSASEIDWGHDESVRRLKQTLHSNRSRHHNNSHQQQQHYELSETSGSFRNESIIRPSLVVDNNAASCDDFKYDSVTRKIYEKFGKEKQFCDYPQKIPSTQHHHHHASNLSRHMSNKLPELKRLRAHRMRKMWENSDQWGAGQHHQSLDLTTTTSNSDSTKYVNNGADAKFLDKILSLRNNN